MRFIDTFDIEKMAQAAHSAGIHLADSREEWLKLMMSMAGGGERLLDSFLLLSSMAGSKYNEKENRREFIKAVRKSSDVGLSYFIDQCEAHGLSRNEFRLKRFEKRSFHKNQNSIFSTHQQKLNTQNTMENQPIQTLKAEWIDKFRYNSNSSMSSQPNSFLTSVVNAGILSQEEAKAAADLFRLGTTKKGEVIFWQIDAQGQLRDGKVMKYDKHCHRCKDEKLAVDWVSHKFRFQKLLPMDWKYTHCLFGLHQIAGEAPEGKLSTVCIVEAEKTAVICSQKLNQYTWMASGGMNALTLDVLKDLVGHRVILYPDTDTNGEAFRTWNKIAWEAKTTLGLDITISDFLEINATAEQKERKIDLADWIAEDEEREDEEESEESEEGEEGSKGSKGSKSSKGSNGTAGMTEAQMSEPLKEMISDYPEVGTLMNKFGLIEVRGGPEEG